MCKYDLLALQRTCAVQLNSMQQLLCRIASTVTTEEDNCEMRWFSYGLQSKLVKLQTALNGHGTFQLPCTHVKIPESMRLMTRSKSETTEIRDLLRKSSKLTHHHTMVSACPAPNILFSSAAFCAAFTAFLAFLISSFLITATVALALGVPTPCIQGVKRAGLWQAAILAGQSDEQQTTHFCRDFRTLYRQAVAIRQFLRAINSIMHTHETMSCCASMHGHLQSQEALYAAYLIPLRLLLWDCQ